MELFCNLESLHKINNFGFIIPLLLAVVMNSQEYRMLGHGLFPPVLVFRGEYPILFFQLNC
jgi:hypothetical protein